VSSIPVFASFMVKLREMRIDMILSK